MQGQIESLTAQALSLSQAVNISLDVIIVAAVLGFLLFYMLYRGKKLALASFNAFVATAFVFSVFPYWENILSGASAQNVLFMQAGAFAGVFVLLRMVTRRMTFGSYPEEGMPRFLEALGMSVAFGGVLLSALFRLLPLEAFYTFAEPYQIALQGEYALFWWLAATFALLYFLVQRRP